MATKNNIFLSYWKILKESVSRFGRNDTITHSAALAYYMVFSLPAIIIIVLWISGLIYDEVMVKDAIFEQYSKLTGTEGAKQLKATLEKINVQKPGWWGGLIGLAVICFTSSSVLIAMQNALNSIFGEKRAKSVKQNIWRVIYDRFISVAMIVTFAFILTVSMVMEALVATFGKYIQEGLGHDPGWLLIFDNVLLDVLALTVLFVLLFRYLPQRKFKWKDTLFGALLTALLFVAGKFLIELFIGKSVVANYYEAAGSILVLMLWVYYTSSIFLFGAIVTATRAEILDGNSNDNMPAPSSK